MTIPDLGGERESPLAAPGTPEPVPQPGRILVLYGSTYGQTSRIAIRIARTLEERGHSVDLIKGDALPADFKLSHYDGVVVGASLIAGRHQRYIERLVRVHRDQLNQLPSAFFSVSGSAGDPGPRGQADARRCADRFLAETAWRPALAVTVAGAITYTKYNPIVRWVMKRISRKAGGSTDTSRDHEYTDWAQVERFALSFDQQLAERTYASPALSTISAVTIPNIPCCDSA